MNISDKNMVMDLFKENKPDIVIILAAQAGVRYSIDKPDVYIQNKVIVFYNFKCKEGDSQ